MLHNSKRTLRDQNWKISDLWGVTVGGPARRGPAPGPGRATGNWLNGGSNWAHCVQSRGLGTKEPPPANRRGAGGLGGPWPVRSPSLAVEVPEPDHSVGPKNLNRDSGSAHTKGLALSAAVSAIPLAKTPSEYVGEWPPGHRDGPAAGDPSPGWPS